MLARIAAAIATAFRLVGKAIPGALDWIDQMIRWPFSVIFGNGGLPVPTYTPSTDAAELIRDLNERSAHYTPPDRQGIDTVLTYARSTKLARDSFDLSAVGADVRTTLLTMNDVELKALSCAQRGSLRKFVAGEQHNIHGVPMVTSLETAAVLPGKAMTTADQLRSRVRNRLLQQTHSDGITAITP